MVQLFNYHYKNNFDRGWEVKVDELIFWVWGCDQPGGDHNVDRKPGGFDPEYKCLSTVGVQVATTFDHDRSKGKKGRKEIYQVIWCLC